uniref:AcidPPc domain-containing protein n=1 Tax=Mesocestoides corti TaxID=53468 RepID=A0A5K3F7W6_MESCO
MAVPRSLIIFSFGEIILLALIATPLIVLQFTEPHQSGFFPGDESIAYPQRPNTVSMVLAAFFSLAAPCLAYFVLEIYIAFRGKFPRDPETGLPSVILHLYKLLGMSAVSFVAMLLIVQVGKETIGSLRPFFLEACVPVNITSNNYQPKIFCSADNARLIEEARMSFPSGHSACSVWGATITSIYLQLRFPKSSAIMLKAFWQTALFTIAFYICLTRIQDNWHRAADVITGSVLGVLASTMTFWTPAGKSIVEESLRMREEEAALNEASIPLSSM